MCKKRRVAFESYARELSLDISTTKTKPNPIKMKKLNTPKSRHTMEKKTKINSNKLNNTENTREKKF